MSTAFLCVDVQNDFMRPDGRLPIPGAMDIVPKLKQLNDFAHEHNVPVVYTGDWHSCHDAELSLMPDFVNSFPPHCMEMTTGAMFLTEVAPVAPSLVYYNAAPAYDCLVSEVVILKNRFSVFEGNPNARPFLERFMRLRKIQRLVVYGVAANICVDQAIRGLLAMRDDHAVPYFALTAVYDATKGINCDESKFFVEWQDAGAVIVSTDDILKIVAANP
jgi:nicotinamidase-related amidase